MVTLTDRQRDVLKAIRRYQRKHGVSPHPDQLTADIGGNPNSRRAEFFSLESSGLTKRRLPTDPWAIRVLVSDDVIFGGTE